MSTKKIKKTELEEKDEAVLEEEDEKAVDAVASELLNPVGVWKCKLKKPIIYQETEYTELNFNFDKLTGDDALNIENELTARGKPVFMNESANALYLTLMAVRACDEPVDESAFKLLSIVDFNRIKNKARLFLLGVAL